MNSNGLPKTYNPSDHEAQLYRMWEESGVFSPGHIAVSKSQKREMFSIIMPPANANGALHIGHAVYVTLEDLMTRFHRMKGDDTLWLPGVDHAGFETQVVFEKKLEKEGQSRFDFDRETLYQKMLDFTLANKSTMEQQLRRLGASCDWSSEKFTLDPDIVQLVDETFKELYQDGLVYRADGIVNWCPKHQTSLSGLEVKYVEQPDPLYYLKYGPFTIATARPETKFGDKYVVVHPADKRYSQYKPGQQFEFEWINGKTTATLIKDPVIDRSFGTGAMTITPWHDAADFTLAKKHQLESEQIIDFSGRLKAIAGQFAGLKIKPAREELVKALKAKGLLAKIDEHYVHSVAVCYKCHTPIEPQIRKQWWLGMTKNVKVKIKNEKVKKMFNGKTSLRDLAVAAVKSGEVKFVTKKFAKIFLHWMKILEDWNLSRQIVWGIQLPVWYCQKCSETVVEVPKETIVYAVRHGQAEHNLKGVLNGDPSKPSDLTEIGRQQAKKLAGRLKNIHFDRILISKMPRTQQTAEIIVNSKLKTQNSKIPVTVDKRLNDIWVGGYEGQPIEVVRQKTSNYRTSVGGSETIDDIKKRCQAVFDDLVTKYAGQTVLVISSEIMLHCLQSAPHWTNYQESGNDHPHPGSFKRLVFSWPHTCPKCGGALNRDPDVFDTWFSSGQWTFAPLMAKRMSQMSEAIMAQNSSKLKAQSSKLDSADFQRFYPTTVMETGWDILFFWVARMIMLGLYKTGEVPFKHVYLHGLVRDKDRQKMSKSKGNVIDPLGVADEFGMDAVRMALVFGTSAGNDMVISEEKIRGMRNFANKVWNIGRFIIGRVSGLEARKVRGAEIPNFLTAPKGRPNLLTEEDKKLWSKLDETINHVTKHIDRFQFHQAAEVVYDFTWHEYADNYLEQAKEQLDNPKLKDNTQYFLLFTFSLLLKLTHPIMPFVTEALWQEMRKRQLVDEPMLITARWPQIVRS